MTDDQAYNLKIIKKVITYYLDENIPNNETGLNMLVDQCDDLVYKIASKIYTESGHKVEFFMIRDVIDSRIEPLQEHIIRIKEEKARKLEAKKLEQEARKLEAERLAETRWLELEEKRRKQEEIRKIKEETIILEEKRRKQAEHDYNNSLKKQLKETRRSENLYTLFSCIKSIVSKQFNIKLDQITLNSNLTNDFQADCLDCLDLIMALEKLFKIDLSGTILDMNSMNSFSECSTANFLPNNADFTVGELVDNVGKKVLES